MASNNQDESAKTIGNKSTDTHISDNIYGYSKAQYYHVHSKMLIYPFLSNGVTATGHADSFTLGSKVEVIPANTIDDYFDIHWIILESVSANDLYCIELYSGEVGEEELISQQKFVKNTTAGSGMISIPVQIPKQSPNVRISSSVASENGTSETVTFSLGYHKYSGGA